MQPLQNSFVYNRKMPKTNEREHVLTDLDRIIKYSNMLQVIEDDDLASQSEDQDSSSEDDDIDPLSLAYQMHFIVNQSRFLNGRERQKRSRDYVLNYFLDQSDVDFRQITRVSRDTFTHIFSLIEMDPIFHNHSRNPQFPLHWQLACALDRLENDGQGVSHARSKTIWGIGQGTVHLYTRRVVRAICNLKGDYMKWPSVEERRIIGRRMALKGFKDVVGFVDGTTFPLHKKPAIYGNVFMDRKKCYNSVNAQIVCDDLHWITYFITGHPGSCGDARVYNLSKLHLRPDLAFFDGEYLLSDSGYGTSLTVVPAYKERQRDDRADRSEPVKISKFNTFLAKARVVNEHTIGILKSRWTSLRGMRIDIHKRQDMHTFVEQAIAGVVLHNLCIVRDPWDEECLDLEDNLELDRDLQRSVQVAALTPGQKKRWTVRNACLAFHDQNPGTDFE